MEISEIIKDLREVDCFDIVARLGHMVSIGGTLLVHGYSDIYGNWDNISMTIASSCSQNLFKDIIITEYPIPKNLEDWHYMFKGQISEINYGIYNGLDMFSPISSMYERIYNHTGTFDYKDCDDKPKHIQLIIDADVVFGMPENDIIESYINLLEQFKKIYMVAVCKNISNYSNVSMLINKYKLSIIDEYNTQNGDNILFISNILKYL